MRALAQAINQASTQPIDPQTCSNALRSLTRDIAAITQRPDPAQPLVQTIAWVQRISADARQKLAATLGAQFPGVAWPDEDDVASAGDQPYWLYDPIDGAYHFLQGLPLWSASLALVQNGAVQLALVYDPALDEMFIAQPGQGASLNGQPLAVSHKTQLPTSVLGTAIPPIAQVGKAEHARALAVLGAVAPEVFVMRQMAAASLQLAYVAAGRLDGYVEVGQDAADWLAASLLVTEAGGRISDIHGRAFSASADGIIAASPALHGPLQALATRAALA